MRQIQPTTGWRNLNVENVRRGRTMPAISADHHKERVNSRQLRLSWQSRLQPRAIRHSNRQRQLQRNHQKTVLSP